MLLNKKKITALFLSFLLVFNQFCLAEVIYNENSIDIQAVETSEGSKYPDYAKMYVGEDRHENFNRKMFNINSRMNKYIARPIHIIWSSIMPKFGMDRIRDAYNNIEYPKRLVSCLIQRDGKAIKQETMRFLTNSTLGLGGLFDPADKIFKIKPTNENMEQALCKCKMRSGSYFVMPWISSCTPRSMCGRAIEAALDPVVYLGSPLISLIKAGLMVNRTSYTQPLAKIIESNYADPYDIHKKLFGIDNYIKNANLDRDETLLAEKQLAQEGDIKDAEKLIAETGDMPAPVNEFVTGGAAGLGDILPFGNSSLKADITLDSYNPQTPVVDSMRTVLFEEPEINKSIWNELSIWNRSFAKRIKTDDITVTDGQAPYHFKYILQKDRTSPVVILYPSIGESAETHHSVVFAKKFYDKGYSAILVGSHFSWEFQKSMPEGYCPGLPLEDSKQLQNLTGKILEKLKNKYGYEPKEKILLGTSFGAMQTLFVAALECNNKILNIDKYIAISPPIELRYALKQADKNADEFDKNSDEVQQKTAATAAKILQLVKLKDEGNLSIETLPFSDEEGKLITTFILRQKLSDLVFTIENVPKNKKTDFYENMNNLSYSDYTKKYLGINPDTEEGAKKLFDEASLFAIRDYLASNNNYVIYHSLDDYFIDKKQLCALKSVVRDKLICLNCGSHLGFLYRKEFSDSLKNKLQLQF